MSLSPTKISSKINDQKSALDIKFNPVNFRLDLNDLNQNENNENFKSEIKLINSILNSNKSESSLAKRTKSLSQLDGVKLMPGLEHRHFNSTIGQRYSLNLGRIKRPAPVISIYEPSLTLDPIEI